MESQWEAKRMFANERLAHQTPRADLVKVLLRRMVAMQNVGIADGRTCSIMTAYGPPPRMSMLENWPNGPLPSYKWPAGIADQVNRTRPNNMILTGQADYRPAYNTRRQALTNLGHVWRPSVMFTNSGDTSLKPCVNDSVYDGCQNKDMKFRGDRYVWELMLTAKTGFHIRGDDFSSARLMDLMSSQVLPVIPMKESFGISMHDSCHTPWQRFSFFLNEYDFADKSEAAMQHVIAAMNDPVEAEKRLRMLEYYRRTSSFGILGASGIHQYLQTATLECLPATVLSEMGIRKDRFQCPYGNRGAKSLFLQGIDEDDKPPYGANWIVALTSP